MCIRDSGCTALRRQEACRYGPQVELTNGTDLEFDDAAFTVGLAGTGDFTSTVLLLTYSSLSTPTSWLAHNMASGARRTRKEMPVLGGFDRADYATDRLWAASHDGVKVRHYRLWAASHDCVPRRRQGAPLPPVGDVARRCPGAPLPPVGCVARRRQGAPFANITGYQTCPVVGYCQQLAAHSDNLQRRWLARRCLSVWCTTSTQ